MSAPLARLLVLGLVVLASCQQATEEKTSGGRLRATVVSSLSSAPELSLWAEGPDGQLLTGAKVLVTAPSGTVTLVGYSATKGCFYTGMGGQGDGWYSVAVDSLAWKQPQVLRFEHQVLRSSPNLTSVSDGIGEVFSGDRLHRDRPWTLAWSPVSGATSYFVQLAQGTSVLWSTTTTGSVALVPAQTLPAGPFVASVIAQYSSGDPLLVAQAYSSVSHSASASLTVHAD